jgi:hypothetical protein
MPRSDIRSELENELEMQEFRVPAGIVLLTLPLWSGVALVVLAIGAGSAWWRPHVLHPGLVSTLVGVHLVVGPLLGAVPILKARSMSIGRKIVYAIAYILIAVVVLFFSLFLSLGAGGF